MIKLLPPNISSIEKYIRSKGVSSLPMGGTFWYEDIPQIPAKIAPHNFIVQTDELGKVHTLRLNEKDHITFIPDSEIYSLPLILQQGIYDYELKTDITTDIGSFQISIKELIYWSWIQKMIPAFTDLKIKESLINNQGNQFLFELIYPNSILNLNNSPFALKNYIASSNEINPTLALLGFASGLFNKSVKQLSSASDLIDLQDEFSNVKIPLPYTTLSRKRAFSNLKNSNEIESITADLVKTKKIDSRNFNLNFLDFSSQVTVKSYVPDQKYLPDYFRYRVISDELDDYDILNFPKITSFESSKQQITYGQPVELTANFYNGEGKIDGRVVESGVAYKFYPTETTTYVLTVSNGVGDPVTRSLTVGVGNDVLINHFSLDNLFIPYGASTTLNIIFSGKDVVGTIDDGDTYIQSGEPIVVSPTETTTYTLKITDGEKTVEQSLILTVLPEGTDLVPTRFRILKNSTGVYLKATFSGEGFVSNYGPVQSGVPFLVSPLESTTYNLIVNNKFITSSFVEVVEDTNKFDYTGQYVETIKIKNSYVNVDAPNFAEWTLYGRQDKYIYSINNDYPATINCLSHGFNTNEELVLKNKKLFYDITDITRGASTVITFNNHKFKVNDIVKFQNVVGMRQINSKTATVTAVSGNEITVNLDSIAYDIYLSGGQAYLGMTELNNIKYKAINIDKDTLSFSTDEEPRIVEDITQENPAQVTIVDHNLTTGDKIIIYNISGMTILNNKIVTVLNSIDSNTFSIDLDTSDDDIYKTFKGSAFSLKLADTSDFTSFPFQSSITGVTKASSAVVTANDHRFSVGDVVQFHGITTMTHLNNKIATVTDVTTNTFTIDLDTTGASYTSFLSGTGYVYDISNGQIDRFIIKGFGKKEINVDDFLEGELKGVSIVDEPLNLKANLDDSYEVEYTEGFTGLGTQGKIHLQTSINPSGSFINNYYIENSGMGYKNGEYLSIVVPTSMTISSITKTGSVITVTCVSQHQLETGNKIKFSDIVGIDLNDVIYRVKKINDKVFKLLDTETLDLIDSSTISGTYVSGGVINIFLNMITNSINQKSNQTNLSFYSSDSVFLMDNTRMPVALSFSEKVNNTNVRLKNIHEFRGNVINSPTLTLVGDFIIKDETILNDLGLNKLQPILPVPLDLTAGENKVINFNWKVAPTTMDIVTASSETALITNDGIEWDLYANAIEKEKEIIDTLTSDIISLKVKTAKQPVFLTQPQNVLTKDGDISDFLSFSISPSIHSFGGTILYEWYKDGGLVQAVSTAVGDRDITSLSTGATTTLTSEDHEFIVGDVVYLTDINGLSPSLNGETATVTLASEDTFTINKNTSASTGTFISGRVRGTKSISSITKDTTPIVTCTDHGFSTGSVIKFLISSGMTELNNSTANVTKINNNTFYIDIDTTSFTTFTSGRLIEMWERSAFDYGRKVYANTTLKDYKKYANSLNNGKYYCVVTDISGNRSLSNTSNSADVFSVNKPTIERINNSSSYEGSTFTATAYAKGNSTLFYQWQKGGSLKAITGITRKNSTDPTIITCPSHGFSNGTIVTFGKIEGMTALTGLSGTVTVINSNSFSVDTNTEDATVFENFQSNKSISAITKASLAVVTCASHGFETGDLIVFRSVSGSHANWSALNGVNAIVNKINDNQFYINVNTSGYSGTFSSGYVTSSSVTNFVNLNIPTYNEATFKISSTVSSDQGIYFCKVTNLKSAYSLSKTSNFFQYTCLGVPDAVKPPVFTLQPQDIDFNNPGAYVFKVLAESLDNGGIISLTLTSGGSSYYAGGSYTFNNVPLTNLSNSAFGSGATANITVVSGVITSVTINKHGKKYVIGDILTADNSNFGNTGVGLKITVNSIYVSEISYQWYKNTNVIPGETKPNLTISIDNPSEDNNAIYHCVATNTRINDNTSASADSQEGNLNYFKVQSAQPLIYDFYPYIKSSARTALLSVYPGDQVPLSEGKTIGSNGEILWDLEKDGALILKSYFPNGGGSWTITPKGVSPEGDCNIRARLWGAGGGAGGLDTISTTYNDKNMDNSPGGGGNYLEGNMTLLSGVTYSFMIGGGGKKGANNASGTGGGRGGYNGGGDGASAGPKHSSGSGGGGGGRTEIKIGLPNNPNQPVIAVAAGGGGGGGEGLVDSTGQFANANTNANVFNNDGNQFFGYAVPIDVDNILDVERNGGTPVNRTGDGGGNGGGGSGWLGGLPSNSYLGNDTNGFGGSPGLNGYDENLFRVEKNFINKGKEPSLQAFSAGTSELKSVRQDPKIEEGLFGAQTTNNTFTGWTGVDKGKAKVITSEDIDNRGLLGKFKYSIGKSDQEGYAFGQNKLNLFNDKGSVWSWQWNAADLNLGNFAPTGAIAVFQYTGAKEIAARTYVSIGDGGQLGDGNPGLIIVEPYSSSSGSSFGKNRCGISLTIKEGKQAVLVLDDGVVKSNETYQWYFEKRSYKDVENTSLQSIQSLENVVEFEDRQLDVEGNSIRAIDFVSVSSGKSKIQNSENASLPVPIPGATLPIYTITSCSSSDAGFYYCIVKSNTPKGKVISSKSKDVRIFVCVAPEITLQPVSVENSQSSGTFTIEAVGNGTLSYEWYRNNVKILNATAQSFSTPDDQSYYCMVTNKLNDVSVSKKSDSVKFSRTFSGAGTSVSNVGGGGGGGGGDAIVLSESPSADGTSIGFYSISAPGVTPLSFSGIGIPPKGGV